MKRFVIALTLLIAAASLTAQNPTTSPPLQPQAVVVQETYDAGNILKGKRLEHAFIIRNTGTAELAILSARPG